MEMDVGVRDQESADRLHLVRREVVRNHMNLTPGWLSGDDVAQKIDERRTCHPQILRLDQHPAPSSRQ